MLTTLILTAIDSGLWEGIRAKFCATPFLLNATGYTPREVSVKLSQKDRRVSYTLEGQIYRSFRQHNRRLTASCLPLLSYL